ncbi:hypothetical protein BB560_004038 [Smittium megazygosporum]|uniref:Mitochondrial import inner membrane translocase subunit n=1 Tax=Smittium megazygosporum TaxID=133381 RepID=A0A2T9ZAH6_9FUNG|nr:hypothetical protein BB560_004038 [Smittium megazygosporum]
MFGGMLGAGNKDSQQPAAPAQPGGFGMGGQPSYQNPQAQMAAVEQEMDVISDFFERLKDSCNAKCIINKYPDGELTKGESVCLDRCVSKYFQVNKEATDVLTKLSQLQQR